MTENGVRDFNKFYSRINKSDKLLPDIEFPDSIFQAGNTSRYYLTTIINGYYPTKEKIRQNTKKAMPASIAVAVLSLGHFYLIPYTPAITSLRIILYDRVDKRVLFYKSSNLSESSGVYIPKANYSELNQVFMSSYKQIYYK